MDSDLEFGDLDELAQLVEENGNLVACVMYQLRDAAGWDRLTPRILDEITNELAQKALGVFPALPPSRRAEVRVYKKGTKLGNLVEAVLEPADHRDDLLRQTANRDSDEVLKQVQRLVCD